MRRTSDLTIDRPRRRFSGRGLIIGLGAFFLFVLVFAYAVFVIPKVRERATAAMAQSTRSWNLVPE